MRSVDKSAKLVDGHYSIGLPLRREDVKMPNNKMVAEQHAMSLKRRFNRDWWLVLTTPTSQAM